MIKANPISEIIAVIILKERPIPTETVFSIFKKEDAFRKIYSLVPNPANDTTESTDDIKNIKQ